MRVQNYSVNYGIIAQIRLRWLGLLVERKYVFPRMIFPIWDLGLLLWLAQPGMTVACCRPGPAGRSWVHCVCRHRCRRGSVRPSLCQVTQHSLGLRALKSRVTVSLWGREFIWAKGKGQPVRVSWNKYFPVKLFLVCVCLKIGPGGNLNTKTELQCEIWMGFKYGLGMVLFSNPEYLGPFFF